MDHLHQTKAIESNQQNFGNAIRYPYQNRIHTLNSPLFPQSSSAYKSYEQQITQMQTTQWNQSSDFRKNIEFMYEELRHNYGALQHEFSLYSKQAFNKVSQLEQQMDQLLSQKEQVICNLNLRNQQLSSDLQRAHNAIQEKQIAYLELQAKYEKIINSYSIQNKHNNLSNQIILKKKQEKIHEYQIQIQEKRQTIQNLKDILHNERSKAIDKENCLRIKDDQIARLAMEVKHLLKELDGQILVQENIRETNKKLKKQISEVKQMLEEYSRQSQLRKTVCYQCQRLKTQNRQLNRKLHQINIANRYATIEPENIQHRAYSNVGKYQQNSVLRQQNYRSYSNLNHSPSMPQGKYNTISIDSEMINYPLNKYNDQNSSFNPKRLKYQGYGKMAQVRESIFHRCKRILKEP